MAFALMLLALASLAVGIMLNLGVGLRGRDEREARPKCPRCGQYLPANGGRR